MQNFLKLALAFVFLLVMAGPVSADTTVKRLAPGVTLTQEIDQTTPLVISVVSVDLSAPGVRLGVGIGQDMISGTDAIHGREDVSRLARRHDALAAINADFFPYTGDPLGVGIQDGELFSEPFPGIRGGGPRVTLGVSPDGRRILFDTLGFLGDLQTSSGERIVINGINRPVGKNEVVVFSRLYGQLTGNRPGGVEVVVSGVNLPVRANKLQTGQVQSVRVVDAATEAIPPDGVVLSAGPGTGANFLARTLHPGDPVSFVLGVAPVGEMTGAFQIATLPRTGHDLPSRSGLGISRTAWEWAQVSSAVGGGPRLLVNGQVSVDWAAEGFDPGFASSLNPRTAVGTTRDGTHLLMVTVDGRQAISRGVTLTDMAGILKRYGAWNAINLDGGGSTTMAVGGLTVSSPQGGGAERPVADMLLVYSDEAYQRGVPAVPLLKSEDEDGQEGTAPAHLVLPTLPILVGGAAALHVQDGDKVLPGSSPKVLWQGPVTGGIGFVNQKGYLIALSPGIGTVSALYQGHLLTAVITVLGKAPSAPVYTLQSSFAPEISGQNTKRSQLVVRIIDNAGKPKANATIAIVVTGGVSAATAQKTDFDGSATFDITWAAEGGGSVRILSGMLAPNELPQP